MKSSVKCNLAVLAMAVGLLSATSALADTLNWSITPVDGDGASGSGTITITPLSSTFSYTGSGGPTVTYIPGSGWYDVTSMTGTLTIDGVGGSVTLVPLGNSLYEYDNVIAPSASPMLDLYGLVFTASGPNGFTNPLELCGDPGCYPPYGSSSDGLYYIWDDGQVASSDADGSYSAFQVDFSVPEPSALSLLTLGLLG
jgi:hypothetical protein